VSIHLMSLVWEIQFPTQTQKLTLLKLADHANDEGGSVFPGNDTLAYQIGCDRRTIQRTIKELNRAKIITLEHKGGQGDGDTNRWRIDVDQLIRLGLRELVLTRENGELRAVENQGGELPPSNFSRVTKLLRRVTPACHPQGDTSLSPKPSLNHHIETSSASADARDGSRTSPAGKSIVSLTIEPRDSGWSEWMEFLSPSFRELAEARGSIEVSKRWPDDDAVLHTRLLGKPKGLTETSKRMTGETA
jgi:hypothetical protein